MYCLANINRKGWQTNWFNSIIISIRYQSLNILTLFLLFLMNSINIGPKMDIFSFPMASTSVLSFFLSSTLTNDSFLPYTVIDVATYPCSAIASFSNTQQIISLKLTNTNYLHWRMYTKLYLLGQGDFHFVGGSFSCPLPQVANVKGSSI